MQNNEITWFRMRIISSNTLPWAGVALNGLWNHLWARAAPSPAMDSNAKQDKGKQGSLQQGLAKDRQSSLAPQDVLLWVGASWSWSRRSRRHRAGTRGQESCQQFSVQRNRCGTSGKRFSPRFGKCQRSILWCRLQLRRRQEVRPMFCLSLRALVYCRLPTTLSYLYLSANWKPVKVVRSWLGNLWVCRCIDKVFMEERLEWEVEVRCEHSYNRRCAKTLKTRYEAAQVEKENKIQILNA